MGELHAGLVSQQFQRHVVGGTTAWRGRRQATHLSLGLAASQHFGQSLVRAGRRHDQHQWAGTDHGNRRERLNRVVVQLGIQAHIDGVRADGATQNGEAVRWCARRQSRAHAATSTALVFNDDRCAQRLVQWLGNHAGQRIGITTGWKWHDIGNGFACGPAALGHCRGGHHGCAQQQSAGGQGVLNQSTALHGCCLLLNKSVFLRCGWWNQKRGCLPVKAGSYLRICPRSSRLRIPQCK